MDKVVTRIFNEIIIRGRWDIFDVFLLAVDDVLFILANAISSNGGKSEGLLCQRTRILYGRLRHGL